MHWFKYLNDANNINSQENQAILTSISQLQAELIAEIEKQAMIDVNSDEFSLALVQEKKQAINELKMQLVDESAEQPEQSSLIIKHVTKAIYEFMPKFSDLRIQLTPSFKVLINKGDICLDILQLSQLTSRDLD